MSPDVAQLVADSGALITVHGRGGSSDRFAAVSLQFEGGILDLTCDGDTDEIVVSVGSYAVSDPTIYSGPLADLAGMRLEYAWELRNHRGYLDAFQVRLRNESGGESILQFEVGASAIDVRQVVESN